MLHRLGPVYPSENAGHFRPTPGLHLHSVVFYHKTELKLDGVSRDLQLNVGHSAFELAEEAQEEGGVYLVDPYIGIGGFVVLPVDEGEAGGLEGVCVDVGEGGRQTDSVFVDIEEERPGSLFGVVLFDLLDCLDEPLTVLFVPPVGEGQQHGLLIHLFLYYLPPNPASTLQTNQWSNKCCPSSSLALNKKVHAPTMV